MRIHRVIARAFGPFHGEALEFGRGMTVVAGPNEAGKSSWHAATRLALTGLRRARGRATSVDAAVADRHRPWDTPDEWSVEALLRLDDGRTIEIRQDLAGKVACAAIDVGIGRDVSDEILDGTPDASRWLGLDRDAFATTVSVSQAQVLAVADAADELQEQMQRAAATRGTDATAAQAIERLIEFRREAVGADTVAARGPLRAAKTRLGQARESLGRARSSHADYLERGARAEVAERRLADARRQLDVAHWGQARAAADRSAARARRAVDLAARHPEPPALANRDEHADQVAAAIDAWVRQPVPPALTGPSSAALEAELRDLPRAPEGDLAAEAHVLAAAHEVDLADEALRSHGVEPITAPPSSVTSDHLRSIARRLRPEPAAAGPRELPHAGGPRAGLLPARGIVAFGLALLVVATVMGVAGASLLAGAIAGVGVVTSGLGVVAWVAGRSRAVLSRGAAPAVGSPNPTNEAERHAALELARSAGLPVDPDVLELIADQALVAERDHEERRRWLARRSELAARRDRADAGLRQALESRGLLIEGAATEAFSGYLADCERRGRQATAAMRREPLERELAARRQAEVAAATALIAVEEAETSLRTAARAAGVDNGDEAPATLVEALRAWQRAHAEARLRGEAASEEWHELTDLLDGGSLADLADTASRRLAAARQLESALPVEAARDAPPTHALEAAIAERTSIVAAADRAWHELKGALETLAPALPDVAAAEEEALAAERELSRVKALAATVDETLGLLRAAQDRVHRDLAPILADAVRRWLPSISGGSYTEVSVDPADLSIQVKEARSGLWRQAKLLSEGTREQVYLLLRVAMAQHLVTTNETAPLLLDEVTAQADGERRDAILAMLHILSRERQVILFSHDEEVADWAEEHLEGPDDCLVRLPTLTRPDRRVTPARKRSAVGVAQPPAAASGETIGLFDHERAAVNG